MGNAIIANFMPAKRKTLPKDFEETLKSGDFSAMKAVFDRCALDAYGGYSKRCALAFHDCPDELARWLVGRGLDIDTRDQYEQTPLHIRAGHWQGDIAVLLELGADVHARSKSGTALHGAAATQNVEAARLLLESGARVDARNAQGHTPLGYGLQQCQNIGLERMAPLAELLLAAGEGQGGTEGGLFSRIFRAKRRSEADDPELKAMVRRLGENFEFHRADFNPEYIDAASAGLERLYELFGVQPVPRRDLHPLDQPIVVEAEGWEDRHFEYWQKLVPATGAAPTVQGEVIRISGRIVRELEGNGGINWDDYFRQMADAFAAHVASGTPLPAEQLSEARTLASELKRKRGDTGRLCELAVNWVNANPAPVSLPKPEYDR